MSDMKRSVLLDSTEVAAVSGATISSETIGCLDKLLSKNKIEEIQELLQSDLKAVGMLPYSTDWSGSGSGSGSGGVPI